MSGLFGHALVWGAVVSGFLGVAFVALAAIDPEMWLNDYPPDIRERFGPMSRSANRKRWILGVPTLLAGLALVFVGTLRYARMDGSAAGFGALALHTFVVLMAFNVVDLVVIDWLLFVRVQPRFIVLRGTEGLAGYSDYRFHWHAFLKGSAGIVAASVIVAGIVTLVVRS
jgi:hypothetical protein